MFEALNDMDLLKEILETLQAQRKDSKKLKDEEETEAMSKAMSEAMSKVISSLSKLEQSHMEHNKDLNSANRMINNPDVVKVCRMEEKIRSLKEKIGTQDETMGVLDQQNPAGMTPLHITTRRDDDEATLLLLNHGANPNVQDPEGNTPLHRTCNQHNIKTATHILKSNGILLVNKGLEMPAIEELFFDQDEEAVKELVDAIDQSRHRKDILDKILRREKVLFRLVDEDKSEILSVVLKTLSDSDQEDVVEFVNILDPTKKQQTALHIAVSKRRYASASVLLKAG